MRDALLWTPVAVIALVAAGLGISLSAEAAINTWDDSGALACVIFLLGTIAGTVGAGIALGLVWVPWAILVAGVAWVAGRARRESPPRVRTAPFSRERRRASWPTKLLDASDGDWRRYNWRSLGRVGLLLLAIEGICELSSPTPFGGADSLSDVVSSTAIFVFAQAFGLLMLAVPLIVLGRALRYVGGRLRLVALALRERKTLDELSDFEQARPALVDQRACARGNAHSLEEGELVAPLSGARCLAFRLRGTVGRYAIDDAQAMPFAVATKDENVAVRAEQFVVALPTASPEPVELSEEQRERLGRFFRSRGLPAPADESAIELGEGLLVEQDDVVVHGAPATEMAGGDGYRDGARRRVLSDADGQPVVIEPG